MIVDSRRVRMTLRRSRKLQWVVVYLLLLLAWKLADITAPAFCRRVEHILLAPFGLALQVTTVLAAFFPVLGLAWFTWHLFFSRRVRLLKLRRIRAAQGRCPHLLSPAPVFGAAYKRASNERDRD